MTRTALRNLIIVSLAVLALLVAIGMGFVWIISFWL